MSALSNAGLYDDDIDARRAIAATLLTVSTVTNSFGPFRVLAHQIFDCNSLCDFSYRRFPSSAHLGHSRGRFGEYCTL